jgi:hypothetical protein
MDAKELRIGNYVDIDNTIQTIDMNIMFDFDEGGWYIDDLHLTKVKPIPLTEEWLVRFGFVYCKNYDEYRYKEKTNWFGIFKSEDDDWLFEKPNMSSVVLPSVHQLQNLYFSLTNEELIIVI